jgi:hypothetical protein
VTGSRVQRGRGSCRGRRRRGRPSGWRGRGADDVDAVQGGLGVDGGLLAAPVQVRVTDVEDEVLGDLVPADDLPGTDADLVLAREAPGGHPVFGRYPTLGTGTDAKDLPSNGLVSGISQI